LQIKNRNSKHTGNPEITAYLTAISGFFTDKTFIVGWIKIIQTSRGNMLFISYAFEK